MLYQINELAESLGLQKSYADLPSLTGRAEDLTLSEYESIISLEEASVEKYIQYEEEMEGSDVVDDFNRLTLNDCNADSDCASDCASDCEDQDDLSRIDKNIGYGDAKLTG
jgi:hypothetical protein